MQELTILLSLLAATIFLKIKFREVLYHSQRERFAVTFIIMVIMISWERYSTTRQIWVYPGTGGIGIDLLGLPIELYIFYLVLPHFVFIIFDLVHKREDNVV
ncbi:MAG: hypothetical protein HYR95_01265 [Candidatus Colwellbacteria bacterium]|nr:hypothetical protein [Candidatus Colwellbacteria bacterium]